jgi:hypothetical protein
VALIHIYIFCLFTVPRNVSVEVRIVAGVVRSDERLCRSIGHVLQFKGFIESHFGDLACSRGFRVRHMGVVYEAWGVVGLRGRQRAALLRPEIWGRAVGRWAG